MRTVGLCLAKKGGTAGAGVARTANQRQAPGPVAGAQPSAPGEVATITEDIAPWMHRGRFSEAMRRSGNRASCVARAVG